MSGDSPPGPCGSSSTDPATGEVDYSHSYGLFQDTPACEGTFLAYWLTGNATSSCTLTGDGLNYVQTAISDYETVLYNKTWPYPAP